MTKHSNDTEKCHFEKSKGWKVLQDLVRPMYERNEQHTTDIPPNTKQLKD